MNILFETIDILESEGYKTKQSDTSEDKAYFEDESLLGFISVHTSLQDIIATWKENQDEFLNKNAIKLRADPVKAWNIYSIFLTSDFEEKRLLEKIAEIEEDFRGSRKIIGNDIQIKNDLVRTLLPLLSIQKIITIQPEDTISRLRKTVNHLELLKDLPDREILNLIIEKK